MVDSKAPTMAAVTESLMRSAEKYGTKVEVVKQGDCDLILEQSGVAANFGCELAVDGMDGGSVTVFAIDVEGKFVGLTLIERSGLTIRRVDAELQNVEDVRTLRDTLSAYIERRGS